MSWAKIRKASEHFGISPRTLRKLLDEGLPHSRLPSGTLLIELEAGDEWLRELRCGRDSQKIVETLLDSLLGGMK